MESLHELKLCLYMYEHGTHITLQISCVKHIELSEVSGVMHGRNKLVALRHYSQLSEWQMNEFATLSV